MLKKILVFTAWALLAQPLQALSHDPFLAWQTLSSPHFDIHYHAGLEALAPQTAAICERRFNELSELFKFQPSGKTQVVLADEDDEANGGATALPYNTIHLIVAPPDEEAQVYDVDAWLDYVISHEMTHVFHLDHVSGFPWLLRWVFGRIPWTTPAYYQPDWVIEGLATWAETDPARGVGRGQSPYFEGLMRLELEAGLKPVRRVNLPMISWPGGDGVYLYGVYFMEFLRDRYGKDSLRKWVEDYSDDWIPYFINRNAKKAFGKKLPALWVEFGAWLKERLGPEVQAIEAQGLRGGPADVDPGGGYFWGPYKAGYAVRRDELSRPRLQRLVKGRWQDLREAYVSSFWPGPKRILYTEDEVAHQAGFMRDLWQVDPLSGRRQRLTWGMRVQEAVETQTGVFAILGAQGQKSLVRLEGGHVAETLWKGSEGENIASLCPSPDGLRLAASHWRRGRGWDIEEFDLAEGCWLPLASRPEAEIQPSYSSDGRTLFFSAAYGGTFNAYAMDLGSHALRQLTNVLGGAFHPWPGEGDEVYFSLMTAQGMVLGVTTLDDAASPAAPGPLGQAPQPKPLSLLAGLEPPQPYSPFFTLLPRSWSPLIHYGPGSEYYGLQLSGDDVLDRHHFDAIIYGHDLGPDLGWSASYSYTRWVPQLGVEISRFAADEWDDYGYSARLLQQVDAFVDLPWQGTWQDWDLSLRTAVDSYADGRQGYGPSSGQDSAYFASMAYDSSTRPRRALGGVDGIQAYLQFTQVDPGQPNDFAYDSWSVARPTSLGKGLELEASVAGGSVIHGDEEFFLGNGRPEAFRPSHFVAFQPAFSFAGYQYGLEELIGPSFGDGHVGLRFPLGLPEWGIMAPPIGLERVHGRVWAEGAQAYDFQDKGQGFKRSVGAAIDLDWVLFYSLGYGLEIGYARGLDQGWEDSYYVNLNGLSLSY